MTPFPWKSAMAFGLGVLRLSPQAFWRMTPRELAAAHRAIAGRSEPMGRTEMERMMEAFPDDR